MEKVITGLTNIVIADVPTPIALPFIFLCKEIIYPVILPSYNDSNTEVSLQNGGYYFALSDNYDLTILGDYYTNGSYGLLNHLMQKICFKGNLDLKINH
jgi:hypothetical protein